MFFLYLFLKHISFAQLLHILAMSSQLLNISPYSVLSFVGSSRQRQEGASPSQEIACHITSCKTATCHFSTSAFVWIEQRKYNISFHDL